MEYIWTKGFHSNENVLTTTPMLSLPNFSTPFIVETNASNIAISVMPSQDRHPITFFDKKALSQNAS